MAAEESEETTGTLAGRVIESETRTGIEGLVVKCRDASSGSLTSVVSGLEGTFELSVPAPAIYFAWVERNPGYYVDGAFVTNLAVPAGGRRDGVELRVRPGVVLRGRVVDGADTAIPDATVFLVDLLNDQGGDKGETVSGPDGRFLFAGQKAGGRFVARAVHPEHGFGESRPVMAQYGGDQEELDVLLMPGQEVQGRLITDSGGAVAGLPVWLLRAGGQPWRPIPGTRTESGPEGRFAIGQVPPGAFEFIVVTAETTRFRSAAFAVVKGEELEPVEVLLGSGPDGYVEGRVTTPEGESLPREEVMAWAAGGKLSGGTRTDSEGRYRIDGLGPSPEVTVEARGFRHGRVRKQQDAVPVSSSGVDFVLGETSSIAGRVVVAQSEEPVTVFHIHGPIVDLDVANPEGMFKVEGIQVSHGVFRFSAEGFLTALYDPGELGEGQAITGVEIVLHPGDWLEGTVHSAASGDPVAGARVKYLVPGEAAPGNLNHEYVWTVADPYTDSLGRFYLQGQPVGQPNSLLVWHPDYEVVVITDSLERSFEIVLTPLSATAAPLPGAVQNQ